MPLGIGAKVVRRGPGLSVVARSTIGPRRVSTCAKRPVPLYGRPQMSNRAIWNVRRRHEWLTKPIKGKRLKKRSRTRIGLQAAMDRRVVPPPPAEA